MMDGQTMTAMKNSLTIVTGASSNHFSRNNPKELVATITNCYDKAKNPDRLEFIVRLDYEDPALPSYLYLGNTPTVRLIIGPSLGYARIHAHYEKCYHLSTGQFVLAYNDDMIIET